MRTFVILLVLAGCGSDDDVPAGALDAGAIDASVVDELIAARPYDWDVPSNYDPAKPTPLLVILHGYSASGFEQAAFLGARTGAQRHGFLLAYPDGLIDDAGNHFWNATEACCNYDDRPVDDVAYLVAVVDDVRAHYNVDVKRIYLMGHSNGGYMAHRLACEHGDRFAAILSLAGMTWADPADCPATAVVNVLQLHGDADESVLYAGGMSQLATYPSAVQTAATWAALNGCSGEEAGADLDLEADLEGAETTRLVKTGCPTGGAVELWTMRGGVHQPSFQSSFFDTAWAWLEAHPKP